MLYKILGVTVLVLSLMTSGLNAAMGGMGGGESPKESFAKGLSAEKRGDFQTALNYFYEACKLDRFDTDTLNQLAYCQYKLNLLDNAQVTYREVLRLKPDLSEAMSPNACCNAALK